MKKFITIFVFIFFIALTAGYAAEKVKKYKKLPGGFRINVGSLKKYEPFVWQEEERSFASVKTFAVGFYPELAKKFFDDLGIPQDLVFYRTFDSLEEINAAAKDGNLDYIMGLHFTDEEFLSYQVAYPPIYYNPITAFLRPDKMANIKKWADLDELKGVAREDEKFSDLYGKQIKNNPNITMVKNSYEAFDMLLKEKTDYFLTSAYSGQAEAFKMGVMDIVAFIRQPKWKDNIFLGESLKSSKTAELHDEVIELLKQYRDERSADSLMIDVMRQWQEKNIDARLKKFEDYDPAKVPPPEEEELEEE